MINITNHQGNANQNHMRDRFISTRTAVIKESDSGAEDVEKQEPSHSADGNGKWCICFGKQCSIFSND